MDLNKNNTALFGFSYKKEDDRFEKISPVPPNSDDGVTLAAGGMFGQPFDTQSGSQKDFDLIRRYRCMALDPAVDEAIEQIVNEAIVSDTNDTPVQINLSNLDISERIKVIMREEFAYILHLFDFNNKAYEMFRRWYVDGRLYYHKVIDLKKPERGLTDLRNIDALKIKPVREMVRDPKSPYAGIPTSAMNGNVFGKLSQTYPNLIKEYFLYNKKGINIMGGISNGFGGNRDESSVKIAKDAITYVTSGLIDGNTGQVLSYLNKSIKALNQLRWMEDSLVIYRLARAPERRLFYIDVGNLPKQKAEQYLRDVMARYRTKITYDQATGEIRDEKKFMCLDMNTKVPLLDGRILTLSEIQKEYEAGKQNWAYSCDATTGKFVPGPISWAGVTKKNSQVVKVTLDNGESIICTPDHRFPVWNKGFVEAKDLVGESIIPGYRRQKELFGTKSYDQIFKNDTKSWEYIHREVSRWKNDSGLREEMMYDESYASSNKQTIHHRNCNRFDNSPSNLVLMNRNDHLKYHSEQARYNFKPNKSEDFTPEWREKLSIAAKNRKPQVKTWKITTPGGDQMVIENLNDFCRQNELNRSNIKYKSSRGFKAELLRNHKAVSVKWLDYTMDVGCLTIDGNETYHSNHTFLLDAGVYTKNSMMEDYWLPRREGGRGTEVSTLPGGQNLGELADLDYFHDKLYKSLNVPASRMGEDGGGAFQIGKSDNIMRDEVNFSKFVGRMRKKFSMIFTDTLKTQLVLKGVTSPKEFDAMKEHIQFDFIYDNHFAEMRDLEILQNKLQAAAMCEPYIGKYFSVLDIRKNILHHTDAEIKDTDTQISYERNVGIIPDPNAQEDPAMQEEAPPEEMQDPNAPVPGDLDLSGQPIEGGVPSMNGKGGMPPQLAGMAMG